MTHAKLKKYRSVKRIKGNHEAETTVRAAMARISLITLNMDVNGTDSDTYWALRDVYNSLSRVVNHTHYTLLKEVKHG